MRVEYLIPRLTKLLTPGKTLFIHYMPDTVKSGVVILPSLTGGRIDPQLRGWRNGDAIQIVSRDPDVTKARAVAQQVSDLLSISSPTEITAASVGLTGAKDIKVVECRPTTEPIVFPRPTTSWWEASVNFYLCWYEG